MRHPLILLVLMLLVAGLLALLTLSIHSLGMAFLLTVFSLLGATGLAMVLEDWWKEREMRAR